MSELGVLVIAFNIVATLIVVAMWIAYDLVIVKIKALEKKMKDSEKYYSDKLSVHRDMITQLKHEIYELGRSK